MTHHDAFIDLEAQQAAIEALDGAAQAGRAATARLRRVAAGGPAFLAGLTYEQRRRYVVALDETARWFNAATLALMDYNAGHVEQTEAH